MGAFDNIPLENLGEKTVDLESGVCEVWFAPTTIVTGTPSLHEVGNGVTLKQLGTYNGPVTLAEGKNWLKVNHLVDASEPKAEGVGPKGQNRVKSVFDFHVDGDTATVLGTQRLLSRVPGLFLVKLRTGEHLLIGTLCNPAYATSSNYNAGKGSEDTVGCAFTVEANCKLGVYTEAPPS